ncbi:hypothetical protein GCM10025867_46170 (plasmid) [Frondihabitans sucicola]|uniref:Holin n=1 Tax=Frondihabitans sucicola TaxID=1268041 RepID=A0ABN6Y5H1_9MICO|nr:hypothetical protein [Frondihabitans sucicola]BDZ52376.1 hypothetical protein GCM10025867_46170 [Frondihabitans sucicola]
MIKMAPRYYERRAAELAHTRRATRLLLAAVVTFLASIPLALSLIALSEYVSDAAAQVLLLLGPVVPAFGASAALLMAVSAKKPLKEVRR